MIRLALIFEILTGLMFWWSPSWVDYCLWEELRILIWVAATFSLSRSLFLRSIILFFWISQMWTFFIFLGDGFGIKCYPSVPTEVITCFFVISWLLFRSYDKPSCAINASGLKGGTYLVVHPPNPKKIGDLILASFGLPIKSVSIFIDGTIYGMRLGFFSTIDPRAMSKKYAIKLDFQSSLAKKILNERIGRRYRLLTFNCVSGLIPFWRGAGLRFPQFAYYLPGIFMLFVNHRKKRQSNV